MQAYASTSSHSPRCKSSLLALLKIVDEQTNQTQERFIYMQRNAKTTGDLSRDEAVNHFAHHAHGVNGLLSSIAHHRTTRALSPYTYSYSGGQKD